MDAVVALFFNRTERRLRAFWRIAIQMVARFLFLFAIAHAIRWIVVSLGYLDASRSAMHVLKAWTPDVPAYQALQKFAEMAAALASAALATRFLDRRRFASLGFSLGSRMWWCDFLVGLAAGMIAIGAVLGLAVGLRWVVVTGWMVTQHTAHSLFAWAAWALVACIANGVEEEVADGRGYMMRNAAEGLAWRRLSVRGAVIASWLLTSAFFGVAHFSGEGGLQVVVNLAAVALLFGLGYVLTGQLAMAIGLHTTWNLAQILGAGQRAVGTEPVAALLTVRYEGPALWVGSASGAFRLESGLLALVACAVGVALALAWVRLSRGTLRVAAETFVYEQSAAPRRDACSRGV
jgi:hypothetical protein